MTELFVREVLRGGERSTSVMVAVDDVIITADDSFFIERSNGEGWNPPRTHRIIRKF